MGVAADSTLLGGRPCALPTREVVGVLEIAADRDAGGDARDAHAERLQQPRQVDRRRLAFDRRVGGEDHFLDAAGADARQQALDLQVVGPDALQRRDRAHQHVIQAAEAAGAIDDADVLRLFDDADDAVIAAGDRRTAAHGSMSVMLLQVVQ